MYNVRSKVMVMLGLFIGAFLNARVKDVRSENNFNIRMEETPFAVVLFYQSIKGDREHERMIRHYKNDLKAVGDLGLYQNAGVKFIALDIARDHLDEVAQRFKITKFPTLILFKGGAPLKNRNRKYSCIAQLSNQASN